MVGFIEENTSNSTCGINVESRDVSRDGREREVEQRIKFFRTLPHVAFHPDPHQPSVHLLVSQDIIAVLPVA